MKQAEEELELARLLAREQSGLEPLVAELQRRVPDAIELGSLASRLALQGIDVAPRPTPTAGNPWKKWLAVGGGGVAVGVLWLGLRSGPGVMQQPTAERAPAVALAASAPPGSTVPPPARGAPAGPGAPGSVAAPPQASSVAAEPGAATPTLQGELAATPAAPPVPGDVGALHETAAPAVTARGGSPSTPRDAAATLPDVKVDAAAAPTELELLRDARLALRSSPARALELAEQHARTYPGGKMTQERELIAISALVALGRRTAALSRGARFEQAFPASPYRKQVGELLR